MTVTTPVYAFPYPENSDPPNGPGQLGALALALETKFVTNDANLPRGLLAIKRSNLNSNSTPITAETVQLSVSFTAVAGRAYRVLFSGGTVDSAGPTACAGIIIMRWAAGGTVTTAGTAIARTQTAIPASGAPNDEGSSNAMEGHIIGAAAGTTTVGITLTSTTAVAVGFFSTSVSGLCLTVEDVGLAANIAQSSSALP